MYPKDHFINSYKLAIVPLTIVIGTICDGGKKAIAISDKMITAVGLSIEFEHKSQKLEKIANDCILLIAGSALNPTEVFENVKNEYENRHYSTDLGYDTKHSKYLKWLSDAKLQAKGNCVTKQCSNKTETRWK